MVNFQAGSRVNRSVSFNPSTPSNRLVIAPINPDALQVDTIITDTSLSEWSIVPMKTRDGKKVFAVQYHDPRGVAHIVHVYESPIR